MTKTVGLLKMPPIGGGLSWFCPDYNQVRRGWTLVTVLTATGRHESVRSIAFD